MSSYSKKDIRTAKRYLTARQIDKTMLGDEQCVVAALADGFKLPEPETPNTTPPQKHTIASLIEEEQQASISREAHEKERLIRELLESLAAPTQQQPQAQTALTEAQIIALIKEHAHPVITLKIKQPNNITIQVEGAHKELERIVKRLSAGMKVYLYGPAGAGKTTLAKQAAEAMQLDFYHTGALLMKYELTGFKDASGTYVPTSFFDAYSKGGLYLFDEIDASNPQAVIAFNQAIENGEMTFPEGKVLQHENFRVIAAANTNGQGATTNYKRNALDGATLDRFCRIPLAYDKDLELRLAVREYKRLGGTRVNQVEDWVYLVQAARAKAADKKIDVIISPRASKNGAAILAMGDTKEQAIMETFGASISKDQRSQIGLRI